MPRVTASNAGYTKEELLVKIREGLVCERLGCRNQPGWISRKHPITQKRILVCVGCDQAIKEWTRLEIAGRSTIRKNRMSDAC